jgi:hypothetical protein
MNVECIWHSWEHERCHRGNGRFRGCCKDEHPITNKARVREEVPPTVRSKRGVNCAHYPSMKFCIFVGVNAGGYAGWLLAENLGLMIAFIASGVGSVVGVYLGWRVARAVLN